MASRLCDAPFMKKNRSRPSHVRNAEKQAKKRGASSELSKATRKDRAAAKRRHEDVNQAAFRDMRESTEKM